ncbi:hypothetical protein AWR36_001735 [Microbulbifer flavimaris]|uniref:Uncharacterized protein n=1 Tax=Microbulbifer flavimaris TaxID=1781068 RepID=A0ABX4I276_9GAMM|nr:MULTISPECIES: glycosyltransferase family 4 protein [Microbulbifer]KUJ84447.1 hypothetical protein AVO43_01735 [Microbulbifer sp. ZGT114]PCO06534.1 hypothetical protein AWR36_001735 [Microbulbifer flavimaris]
MIDKICHLIASREHDGLARHVAELSRWQVRNTGAEIAVIAHPRYRESLDPSVRFLALNTDRNRHHPNLAWRLTSHLRSGGFQIAHGHGSKSAQLLAAVQKYSSARQVITRHNLRHPRDKLSSAFDARIAVSHSVVENSRLDWNVIPNGATASAPLSPAGTLRRQAPQLLFSGRLVKLCGLDHLLNALPGLPEAELTVAGDGPEGNALKRLASDLGLAQRVQFIGDGQSTARLLSETDLLVITSCAGNPPFDWIEALLHRCPVITPNTGDADRYIPPQFILDNVHPLSLEQKLQQALSNLGLLQSQFTGSFERAGDQLTLDAMGRATWEVYTRVVREGSRKHASEKPG